MVSTSGKIPVPLGPLILLMAATAGCVTSVPADQSHLSTEDPLRVMLQNRTDDLLRDLLPGDLAKVRPYFAPEADVDVRQQMELYLNAPLAGLQIVRWDGAKITVDLSSDRRRARTSVLVEIAENSASPVPRALEFLWTSSADGEPYYLVPQRPPNQLR